MASVHFRSMHRFWPLAVASLALAACASVPPPDDLLAQARQQLDSATQAGAGNADPVDLDFARKRLTEAGLAMQKEKYALARDLAEESMADGRLAEVRAQLAAARGAVRAQAAENERLRANLLNTASDNQGLPAQVVLPQATAPAPAASAPASATSTGGQP